LGIVSAPSQGTRTDKKEAEEEAREKEVENLPIFL